MPEQNDCATHTLPEDWYAPDPKEEFLSWAAEALATRTELSSGGGYRRRAKSSPSRTLRAGQEDILLNVEWLISEINQVAQESAPAGGSSAGVVPVDEDTKRMATKFAAMLPLSIQLPEVAADPDGEISFDWLGPSGKMFSVSVDRNGRLAYAGRFGNKTKKNGVEQLSETCPPEIILGIERAVG